MLPTRSPTVRPIDAGHRHPISRRSLLTAGAGMAGLVAAGTTAVGPAGAATRAGAPRPIPGGIQPFGPGTEVFHVFPPGTGEPNTITDFNGFAGAAEISGTGAGEHSDLTFDVDNRFYTGEYVGLDGRHHNTTFGFL